MFECVQIWVQVFGLPMEWHSPQLIEKLGNSLGEVVHMDLVGESGYSFRAARVRVKILVANPLVLDLWVIKRT